MIQVTFFEKDGKIHFTVPESPGLEAAIRKQVKTQSVKIGKKEFFFRRGIIDAARAIQSGTSRNFGPPIVELTDPFTGERKQMPCQKAKEFMQDIGGLYQITQVRGSKLSEGYFSEFRPK